MPDPGRGICSLQEGVGCRGLKVDAAAAPPGIGVASGFVTSEPARVVPAQIKDKAVPKIPPG